jgi:thiamine biosynthesis protein ThiI
MEQCFLIKYGEIGLKGKNRYLFEDALVRQIRYMLKGVEGNFHVYKAQGRVYIDCTGDFNFNETVTSLQKVFGIVGICPVTKTTDQGFEKLAQDVINHLEENHQEEGYTFKVEARRSRKNYPLNSMEINRELGAVILQRLPKTKVDVHKPDVMLNVEIREDIYIYSTVIPGLGGMPVGTNGKAMLLLSGGIDSPVAGYLIAKRGVALRATYFHAPPYTSERAKDKVIDLAKIISKYAGPIKLNVVNFTEIQLEIYEKCPHEELTIIMRRYMMKIAEHFAKEDGCLGLITGESIGQVASQTMESLAATDEVCTLPAYRPLISFDKSEIVEIAQKIDTFETSILPYEDCCTIFVAKHPVTKPRLERIQRSEEKLVGIVEPLVEKAIKETEVVWIKR